MPIRLRITAFNSNCTPKLYNVCSNMGITPNNLLSTDCTQTQRRFQLCFTLQTSLSSLVFHHSPVFSLQQRSPDGIKARIPVSKSSRCLSLQHLSGGSLLKSTVADGGWWICSQGLSLGGGKGVELVSSLHPSIHLTIFPCRLLPQLRIITHDASPLPL